MIGAALLRDLDGPVLGALGGVAEGSQRALGVGEGEVPRVVGLTEGEARERLAEEGFGVAVERRASAERDEGRVLEQSVSAGKEARRGSRVALAVGDGRTSVEAPDLVGMRASEAEEELRRAGLKLGERRESPSRDVPEGEVVAQKPAAGEEAKRGAEVDLTVSSGPPESGEADRVEIPDVSGLGVEEATELLRGAGYEVAGTRREPSSEPEGAVIGTDPPTGQAVASGTPVILVVSDGPGEPPAAASPPSSAPASSAPSSPGPSSSSPAPSYEGDDESYGEDEEEEEEEEEGGDD
ncbi:MAG: PASTA domain-containing protein [Actinomycetota bacterium]|nr:PASTA domain-containing protein [Actinomycetota bacterium]